MKRFSVYTVLVFLTLNLMGQNDEYGQYYRYINEHISKGNCESAQKLYNIFKQESGKSDKDLEARIAQCLSVRGGAEQGDNNSSQRVTSGTSRGSDMTFVVGGVEFKMVRVDGGTFTMGCTLEQGDDCWDDEKPAHSVTLSSYYMGETEVTQALWKAVMVTNPSYFKGDDLPVERVSWDDVQEFIRRLNAVTGRTFRLPTEAEWEYAARGGSKRRGYKYSGSNSIDDVAWYDGNSGNKTHPVIGKRANELGLYDMSGNVWEWCSDRCGNYSSGSQTNPQGPSTGAYRVYRGGGWCYYARGCRVSYRGHSCSYSGSHLGFRLVLGL